MYKDEIECTKTKRVTSNEQAISNSKYKGSGMSTLKNLAEEETINCNQGKIYKTRKNTYQ